MDEKVLEIEKNTNVMFVKNKQNYTKLVLHKPINLNQFPNVKEVEFKFDPTIKHRINFSNLEKIKLSTDTIGKKSGFIDTTYHSIPNSNIRSIEFGDNAYEISSDLLNNLNNLEELIFNISKGKIHFMDSYYLITNNSNIKKITIKYNRLEFPIELDYKPNVLREVSFDKSSGIIKLEYIDENITTQCSIKNGKVLKDNLLDCINDKLINNNTLYIPDYVTNICISKKETIQKIEKVSLSLNILNSNSIISNEKFENMIDYDDIKSIEIRNNNEMSLNKTKEISTEEYGKIQEMEISTGELKIDFENKTIIIDKSGNMKETEVNAKCENNKIIEEQETKETTKPISSYEYEKLRLYTNFKEILQFFTNNDNKELKKSLDVVEKHLIKEIDKN